MAMVGFNILSRSVFLQSFCRPCKVKRSNFFTNKFSTYFGEKVKNIPKRPLKFIAAGVPVTVLGAGYYMYKFKQEEDEPQVLEKITKPHTLLPSKPNVPISRSIKGDTGKFDLQLTLFQYPTCPFCCKVRAFLDYYGLPYDVVEVDPVLRQQTSWTTYKKVPILLAKVDGGYQQLNDSTMIISALKTYLLAQDQDLKELVNYYPIVDIKDKGGVKSEILNKYFLMYRENLPRDKTTEVVFEEKNWRQWADDKLVHMLSPNVYRTFDESMQAFQWFSEVGEWDRLFPAWERNIIVYVGALAMWIISKRLKKRHNLTDDVRQDLYNSGRHWMKAISAKNTTFMGGNSPNLADLAVYGVLSSIEGCLAFNDLLKNTKIGDWYYPMKEAVKNHDGKKEIGVPTAPGQVL